MGEGIVFAPLPGPLRVFPAFQGSLGTAGSLGQGVAGAAWQGWHQGHTAGCGTETG